MKITTRLEDIRGAADVCLRCSRCTYGAWPQNHPVCPIYIRNRCFTYNSGGLVYIVNALLDNKIDYIPSVAELAFTCTSCLACDSNCCVVPSQSPYHVSPLDVIRLLRYESVKRGQIPEGMARKIYEEVQKKEDYGEASILELPEDIKSDKANTVIFSGCSHSKAGKTISAAVARLLAKIGSPVASFSEKGCCGSTLYDFGLWDQLNPLIEANWEKMRSFKDRDFVFISPHCHEFIVKRYPENVPESKAIKHQHISQFLITAFKTSKLKSRKADNITVSYHDPCYLGRGLGIYDAPRDVLSSLKGVKLVEMERNREDSFCCGARTIGNYFPDMAEWTARERIKEFVATKADLLITACAYCKDIFQNVMPEKDKNKVKDLSEFVDERT